MLVSLRRASGDGKARGYDGRVQTQRSDAARLLEEIVAALTASQPSLPCKLFYDARGVELYEQICRLPEYYLTRTELAIMKASALRMAELIGKDAYIIELGSGSGEKLLCLLEALESPAAYAAIDVSRVMLEATARTVRERMPGLEVIQVAGDLMAPLRAPPPARPASRRVAFFPGSTVGNFTHAETTAFLCRVRELVGASGGLLIGADLDKDPRVLEAAYDDSAGVTARFNLNLLHRLTREFGARIQIDAFRHQASYDREVGRIEMRLVASGATAIEIAGRVIRFAAGDFILTEYCHKYTTAAFVALAKSGGFAVREIFTDAATHFAVFYAD